MDDLNVDHYNIDDIFDLVDVPKYDFEEMIEILDIYADAYTKENSIILTNFILQIKSKVMDYIQSIGLEYTTNTDSYKTIETNKNIESDGYNRNEMKKYQEDPINSVIDIVPRSDTPESNLEYLEEDDIIENDKFVYNPSISIDDTKYAPVGNNLNNSASTNNLLQEVMPNFTQALGEELPSSMTQDQVPTQNTQNTQKPLNQFEEDYIEKVLIFNSGFRKPVESINDYLIDMAEPLQNVTSLQLTSYTLTYNIYNIDEHNQTNVLFMTDSRFKEHIITVKSGYYTTPEQLVSQINTTINEHFTSDGSWNETDPEDSTNANGDVVNMSTPQPVTFEYDSLNGRVRIKVEKPDRHPNPENTTSDNPNYGYPNRSRTGPFIMYVTFFALSQGSTTKYNFNLGYFLGFRRFFLNSTKGIGYYVEFKNDQATEGQTDTNNDTISNVFDSYDASTDTYFNVIETEGMVDLKHPKYLMLSLDEYNQNRANSNVIQVNDGTNNTVRDMLSRLELPKNPRQRPLAHIYAHNERIIGNMNELRKQRIRNYPQTIPDTFADIPFPSELKLGSIINNQGQNTASIPPRKYFGPINIKRFRVRLFDEKGNLVNLNNTDYTFSVKLKMLYNNNVIKSSQIESGDIESEDIESKNNDTKKD